MPGFYRAIAQGDRGADVVAIALMVLVLAGAHDDVAGQNVFGKPVESLRAFLDSCPQCLGGGHATKGDRSRDIHWCVQANAARALRFLILVHC